MSFFKTAFLPEQFNGFLPALKNAEPPNYNFVEWVESNRTLDRQSSAEPGYKRISRTPYLRQLYEWFADERIREIVIQKPAQIGITDWVVDCILWVAVNDPSPTALFLADQDTARKIMRFRLAPAFKSLGLTQRKSAANKQQEISKFEIQLTNGFYLAVSWGSSVSQTASMSFKRVFCDEVNKEGYGVSKDEGETLGRIRERMETFGDSKFVLLSTPTTDAGRITAEFESCDVKYDYCCPCPFCGAYQPLTFDRVVWDGGSMATREKLAQTAGYQCRDCAEIWSDEQRQESVKNGMAIARESTTGERVGYQLHRLNSLFKGGNMAKMVYNFLQCKKDPFKLQNVINSVFGEPWVERISQSADEAAQAVQQCYSNYSKSSVPPSVAALVAGIDVQNNGFWFRVRGFAPDLTSWGIEEKFIPTWEELEVALYADYGGQRIWRAMIDTGGGKADGAVISRTEETYEFIRRNSGRGVQLFGAKGSSRAMPTKIKVGQPLEKTPSGKPIPGGIRIIQINTQAFKDALWWRIEKAPTAEPGAWWLHNETPAYFVNHIVAEEKRRTKTGAVEWVVVSKDNHLLDCEVLCLACVDPEFFGGLRPLQFQQQQQAKKTEQKQKQQQPNPYTQGLGFGGGNPYGGGY